MKKPRVGRNEQVRGAASGAWVVSEPPTTATIRPRPVSVSRLSHCTVIGGFCTGVGDLVPSAVNTKPVCPAAGPGGGSWAGPGTARAVPTESLESPMQPLPMVG
ncbi:Uncharacterised protein [Mycobacteroides abscessus subsp. abscessus]|nr:Uncharacterised protein [Mycobacteroides abscessus subsp. abscessus]